ncbi:MAG: hypothetical protein IJR87_04110 [Bacteroidaceae bacterium]|nr:hypothetical protein [Bacteroidaceae bacterium]
MKHPILWGLALLGVLAGCLPQPAGEAEQILRRQTIRFTEPPHRIPSNISVDAPLMGNGFTGVALAGPPEKLVFHISRNDFWRRRSAHDEAYPLILGRLQLTMPQLEGASYDVEQHLYDATTVARFAKGSRAVTCESFVAATEDLLLVRLKADGMESVSGSFQLVLPSIEDVPSYPEQRDSGISSDGIQYIVRAFADSVEIPTRAAAALRADGCPDGSFTLQPGKTLTLVCAFSSDFKADDCLKAVIRRVSTCGNRRQSRVHKAHCRWWKDYWQKSYVSIPDSVIERQYYRSLYGMASCSRDADFPPGLFGSWITQERPAWSGDYHLNYNYQASFYALYSANRLEQAEPYHAPLLAAIPRGNYYSEKVTKIPDGILLPVGIGPLGVESTRWSPQMEARHSDWRLAGNIEEGGMFWGQKSNAAYAVCNLAMQFYRTWDPAFARMVYPFVKGVATFWEHYLTPDGDRYVILNDAIHEGTVGTMNPIASLGLVRLVMQTACDMSELLDIDADRREAWRDRHDRLADYPVQEREGKTVFRYTEQGIDWWGDNTLGIQHIYPAGQIGHASEPRLLETARNTIGVMHRWSDFNGTNSFFPAAVRVGFPADTILTHLHQYALHTYPNGFQRDNPHGPENWSTVPNTINEMLCSGHQDLVRLFPVWPRELDASFRCLRVEGAFLVSARLCGGRVGDVSLLSERGRPLVLQNPWGDAPVIVEDSGGREQTVGGTILRLPTLSGHTYRLRPATQPVP